MRPVTDEVQLQRLQSYAASLLDTWAARACLCARTAPFKKMLGRCIEENGTHSCIMKTLVSFQAQTECGGMAVSSPWTKLGIYAFMGKCSASSLPLMTAPRTAAHSLQDSLDSLSALWAHCCANKKLAEVCALYRLYDHVSLAASCLHLTWAHTVKAGWLWAWAVHSLRRQPPNEKIGLHRMLPRQYDIRGTAYIEFCVVHIRA